MPLTASFNGVRIESHRATPEQWLELKGTYKKGALTMSCGQPGVPKTRRNTGHQFFAHKPGADCNMHESGPETKEHLAAKAAIEEGARAVGWKATIEAPSMDRSWIADVLAEKDGRKIAMEVQWSPQSPEDFSRRQQRYARDGVECIWFVSERNTENAAGVPCMVLTGDAAGFTVTLPNGFEEDVTFGLAEAAGAHLSGRYGWHMENEVQGLQLLIAEKDCYRQECGKPLSIWWLRGIDVESRCGIKGRLVDDTSLPVQPKSRVESVIAALVMPLMRESGVNEPAYLSPRHSSAMGKSYLAYCCPHCEAVQSDYYNVQDEGSYYAIPAASLTLPLSESAVTLPHLCKDSGRSCQPGPPAAGTAFPMPHYQSQWEDTLLKLSVTAATKYPSLPTVQERELERITAEARLAEQAAKEEARQRSLVEEEEAYRRLLKSTVIPEAVGRMHPPRSEMKLTTEPAAKVTDERTIQRMAALNADSRPEESDEPNPLLMSAEDCVAALGRKRLRLALFHALEHLDRGSLKQVEAAKMAKGEANLYPILLGGLYPGNEVAGA